MGGGGFSVNFGISSLAGTERHGFFSSALGGFGTAVSSAPTESHWSAKKNLNCSSPIPLERFTTKTNAHRNATYSYGSQQQAFAVSGPMNATINYTGPTLNFNGMEFITPAIQERHPRCSCRGAKLGETRAMNRLRQSRSTRSKIGF